MRTKQVLICLGTVFILSCKVVKDVDRKATIYRKPEKVIGLTKANDLDFQAISIRANVHVSDGKKKTSFKANIRMYKDSVIWSSLSMIGIAGAKTLLTKDSVKVVNYRGKSFVREPYATLHTYLNSDILSLSNLQRIFLGDWMEVGDFDRYRMKYNDTNYLVSTISERRIEKDWMEKKIDKLEKKVERKEEKDSEKAQELLEKKQERKPRKYDGIALEIEIDPFDLKVQKMRIKDYYFDGLLNAEYSDFKMVNNALIPHHVNMTVEGSNKLTLDIEYYKISLDHEISTPFSIPKKYEKVDL